MIGRSSGTGRADGEIGRWPRSVEILHIPAASAVDGKTTLKTRVETSRADDGIHRSVLTVSCHDAGGVNVRHWSRNHVHVVGCKRFEVTRTRRKSLAQRRKVWLHVLYDFGFLRQSFAHVPVELCASSVLRVGAYLRHCKSALHAGFKRFTIFHV